MCLFLRFAYAEQNSSLDPPPTNSWRASRGIAGCPNACNSTHMQVFTTPRVKLMYSWFKFLCVPAHWS
eukprot:7847155-Pyramimonas_sp.AAC.1